MHPGWQYKQRTLPSSGLVSWENVESCTWKVDTFISIDRMPELVHLPVQMNSDTETQLVLPLILSKERPAIWVL